MVSPPSFLLECFGVGPSAARQDRHERKQLLTDPSARAAAPTTTDEPNCIFCNPTVEKGFRVVLEDTRFVAFHDRSPAAELHLLVVPRRHVENVKTLRSGEEEDVQLVRQMKDFGSKALDIASQEAKLGTPDVARSHAANGRYTDDPGPRRYGFHVSWILRVLLDDDLTGFLLTITPTTQIPPFRSVEHLHLHCLHLPFVSDLRALKYRVAQPSSSLFSSTPRHKGWSWFVQWQQAADILADGGHIKVKPC